MVVDEAKREPDKPCRKKRDRIAVGLKGTWWYELECESGKIDRSKVRSNLITVNAKVLLAALLKNDATYVDGIMFHAVGSGDPDWDTQGTPDPIFAQTTLLAEAGRKVPTQIVYVDGSGDPSVTPTGIIRIKTVFEKTDLEPTGVSIREHGLFGGNATSTVDSGLLIDAIHMPAIFKDNTMKLTLFIELEF